ncbi:MAG: calcium/sodium antiporter [Pseudomonadota bacterium]
MGEIAGGGAELNLEMSMVWDMALVAAGLVLLLAAGDILVRGAITAGLKMRVPAIIIGLTIVAFGTSAPELFVTVQATIDGAPGIAVGNVIGSNIANVLLVLGVPALLAPIGDHSPATKRNYEIMLGVTLVTVALCMFSPLTWWQGSLLLTMLVGFLIYNYRVAMATPDGGAPGEEGDHGIEELEDADPDMPNWKVAMLIIGGLVGLPIGASFIVDGASGIASNFGVSDATIGLTIVALGTSLPELATTVVAAMRGRTDVAIGNVIGSNVFNLLCILGVAASLGSIEIPPETFRLNLLVMIAAALALAPFVWLQINMSKIIGGAFVGAYAIYMSLVFATGAAAETPVDPGVALQAGPAVQIEAPVIAPDGAAE